MARESGVSASTVLRGVLRELIAAIECAMRVEMPSPGFARPCCMDHPEGCLIIVFFNTGDNLDAT